MVAIKAHYASISKIISGLVYSIHLSSMKVFAFLILTFIVPVVCNAQLADSTILKIDKVFQDARSETPGFMVAVIQNDKFVFEKGYGLSNLEHDVEISKTTNFNIASLSKQFTGAAIALLIKENKLSLEDLVSDHIDAFPFATDSLSVKHLIYMTSGINDYYYNQRANGSDWSSLNYFNVDTAIIASYGSEELMYRPGSQWSYSNVNYMLLTKIVESVSGLPFPDYMKQNIFEPLGMINSLVNDDIFQVIPNRALGYNFRTEEETGWLIESGYIKSKGDGFLQIHRNAPHYGGSGIYTTMDDFKLWIKNFDTKELGGQKFYDLMHKTMKFDHDKSNDAFGLVVDKYEGKDIVWYEGGDWGFSSFMLRFPDSQTTLICFSNIGTGNARSKVWSVYDILHDAKLIE